MPRGMAKKKDTKRESPVRILAMAGRRPLVSMAIEWPGQHSDDDFGRKDTGREGRPTTAEVPSSGAMATLCGQEHPTQKASTCPASENQQSRGLT